MLKNNKYGLKTDLWSIGILYYNMLYGFPPFYFEDSYLSNEVALKVIESNFDKIFDKHYQMNMKKKFNITKDMPELSERTINFLKKLIVIDPK